jgi:hypothetical protein
VDVGVLIAHGCFYNLAEFVHCDPPPKGQEPVKGQNAESFPLLLSAENEKTLIIRAFFMPGIFYPQNKKPLFLRH